MKFYQHTVVFNEIPNEVTLVFEITNCPHHCEGCHSPHLWEDVGRELTKKFFIDTCEKYATLITNVAFFGGDQHEPELLQFLELCQAIGIKASLWTGATSVSDEIKSKLHYLKLGHYDPKFGGLDVKGTNQVLLNVKTGEAVDMQRRRVKAQGVY